MLNIDEVRKKMSGSPRRTMVVIAAAVVTIATAGTAAFLSTAGKEERSRPLSHSVTAAAGAVAWQVPQVRSVANDPSTWTLPLSAYQVVDNEVNGVLLQAAEQKLTAQCMKDLGVVAPFTVPENWSEAVAAFGADGPQNAMDARYGDHDLAKVSQYGYGWPDGVGGAGQAASSSTKGEAMSDDVRLALQGWQHPVTGEVRAGVPRKLGGSSVPPRGCGGQAQTELTEPGSTGLIPV
ncbi:hypothetical protein [Streptomyces sp. NPDC051286]|uniref:hypothetical protein n=1 Tax=Streptomyces sp. NPDC051286 TaxID=3365647 RepID=UPI0037B2EF9E